MSTMRLATLASFALVLPACTGVFNFGDVSDRSTQTQTRDVDAFEAISMEGSVDIEATVGPSRSLEVEAAGKVIDDIETTVEGGTLHVRLDRGLHVNAGRMLVRVTVPQLNSVAVSGAGDARISDVDAESFSVSINGSGDVEVDGKAAALDVAVSGSGDVRARSLTASSATVSVRGSGDVTITAEDTATGTIQGSGDVTVHGGASCTIAVQGSGDVNC